MDFKEWNEKHIRWKLDTFAWNRQQYVPFKKTRHFIKFDYVVTDTNLNMIDIVMDIKHAMRFTVKLKQ